jgi:hypothetical protein
LGYTEEASATAFTKSYQEYQHAAIDQEPSSRVKGVLTDGFDSTTKSMRTLFPGVRVGTCLRVVYPTAADNYFTLKTE